MTTISHNLEDPKAATTASTTRSDSEFEFEFEPLPDNAPSSSVASDDTRTAALICALLIAGFAAIGTVMLAINGAPEGPTQVSDCASLSEASSRLACFDALARHLETGPSKGALAPPLDRAP